MTSLHNDAISSFVHLTDNVPRWLTQLNCLSEYTIQKHTEYVAEYTGLVDNVRPQKIKSSSLQSIHSDTSKSVRLADIDLQTDSALPTPPNPVDINPLEAGNKYLYAQIQRKRKPTSSVRSGASGPQKFRSKNQAVIHYDAHIQTELDAMVKAIGVARNNMRKSRNAFNASQGFSLPSIGKKATPTPSLDDLRPTSTLKTTPIISASKFSPRSNRQSATGDDAVFISTDKLLDSIQGLYETAAHQFLRDGDCKTELETASTQLASVLAEAKRATASLQQKLDSQKDLDTESDESAPDSVSDISRLDASTTFDPLKSLHNKYGPATLSRTLDDMKHRSVPFGGTLATGDLSSLPTVGVEIEVDTDDDNGSFEEFIDISQFRAGNRLRVARAY